MKAVKVVVALILTVLFGKAIPLLAVFLLIGGIAVIIGEAVKEGKEL